jgi:hypothetical protein
MQKSPAAIVKEKFGDKAKLVAALKPFTEDDSWLPRVNAKKGLERVSNAKLLRLHELLSEVKEKFGGRLKLVDAVCELEKRTKDEGYKRRLLAYPVPRLYDHYRAAAKRHGRRATASAAETGASPKPRAPKAQTVTAPKAAKAKSASSQSGAKASAAPKKKAASGGASKRSKAGR